MWPILFTKMRNYTSRKWLICVAPSCWNHMSSTFISCNLDTKYCQLTLFLKYHSTMKFIVLSQLLITLNCQLTRWFFLFLVQFWDSLRESVREYRFEPECFSNEKIKKSSKFPARLPKVLLSTGRLLSISWPLLV